MISPRDFGRALRRALNPPRGGPGIAVTEGPLNDSISLSSEFKASRAFPARVTSAAADGTNRWAYAFEEVQKVGAGYGGWAPRANGRSGTCRNLLENMNDGAGVEGNGIDVDGPDFPSGFQLRPIPVGAIVWVSRIVPASGVAEWWTEYPNAVDGECDAVALASQVGFAVTLGTDETTTSTTFAKVNKWNGSLFEDTDAFTFSASTGDLTLVPGTYRIAIRPAVTAVTNDATMTVRIRESTDGGTATTVGGTVGMPASATASEAIIQYHVAYFTVAAGSWADIWIEIARDLGTGTATLEASTTLWEVERVG